MGGGRLIHAVIISPFIRKELQLTFYANETISPLHGRLSKDGKHIIDFHPQHVNNPETVTGTVESEHDKTNIFDLSAQRILLSVRASAKSDQSASVKRKWILV